MKAVDFGSKLLTFGRKLPRELQGRHSRGPRGSQGPPIVFREVGLLQDGSYSLMDGLIIQY